MLARGDVNVFSAPIMTCVPFVGSHAHLLKHFRLHTNEKGLQDSSVFSWNATPEYVTGVYNHPSQFYTFGTGSQCLGSAVGSASVS